MIRNPNDIQEGAKKIRMLIAGYPGIGKSTLALSAPNPLHIDVDFGIDRIEPRYRKPYIQPQSYDEILGDLTPINLQDFDTLVFDTGGKLISLMSLWAIKKDPKYGQRDGSLSLKGLSLIHISRRFFPCDASGRRSSNAGCQSGWCRRCRSLDFCSVRRTACR